MNLSPLGIALIQFFEDYTDKAYRKFPQEPWTCGWGHTGPGVTETTICTPERALAWFMADVSGAESAVSTAVRVTLYQHEFDALVSLVYNAGRIALQHRSGEAWESSTLLLKLNAMKISEAAGQFLQWDHIGGAPDKGLLRRRQLEQALFLDSPAAT